VDMDHSSVIVICDDLQLPIVIRCVHEDGCVCVCVCVCVCSEDDAYSI